MFSDCSALLVLSRSFDAGSKVWLSYKKFGLDYSFTLNLVWKNGTVRNKNLWLADFVEPQASHELECHPLALGFA